jgi:uncharacterized repeat protein (TIGR03803 family)
MSRIALNESLMSTCKRVVAGTVLAAAPLVAQGATLTTIHNFTGGPDGASPVDGLLVGANGLFYGTASAGGTAGLGAVFQMNAKGHVKVLHGFVGGTDGASPNGGVIQDAGATLFGTTTAGGAAGAGTVFSVHGESEAVLYSFAGGSKDGAEPQAGLAADAKGNLYGTTSAGGVAGTGTVFELVKPKIKDGTWTEKLLYSFAGGTDGAVPVGRVAFDTAGNIFGTTSQGGTAGYGTVFELQQGANGWQETTLHEFLDGTDGGTPYAGLVADASGNFYGAATQGGANGGGTIFALLPANGGYTFSVPASVPGWGISGTFRDVLLGANGVIYATTHCDGNGSGSIYQLTQSAGVWTYTLLYNFTGGADGQYSISNLVLKGNSFYGTTIGGGANGAGTVYGFTP